MGTHFTLVLKIEKVETRNPETARRVSAGSSVTERERKLVSEMSAITLRASSYEGILLKAEKMLQLERDLGEDGKLQGEGIDEDEEEE